MSVHDDEQSLKLTHHVLISQHITFQAATGRRRLNPSRRGKPPPRKNTEGKGAAGNAANRWPGRRAQGNNKCLNDLSTAHRRLGAAG